MCNEVVVFQFELTYRQMSGRAKENHLWCLLEEKKVPRWGFLNLPSITSTCKTQGTCSVWQVSVSRNKPLPPPRFGMTRKNLTCGPTLTAKPNSGYSCLPAREHNRVLSEAWCLKLCPCTVMLSQLACHYSTHSLQPEECCQLRWDVSIRLFSCIKNTRKTENLYARYKKNHDSNPYLKENNTRCFWLRTNSRQRE